MSTVAMEMSLQKTGPHERKLMVTVPAEAYAAALQRKLQALSKNIKADGFRPGKMPMNLVEKKAGPQARYEVLNQMTEDSIRQTIENEKIILASRPVLDVEKSGEEGGPLQFTLTFEIYPEVALKGLEKIAIDKPKICIADSDIDEAIERLRVRAAEWVESDKPAAKGARVRFKLFGHVVGETEKFENGSEMTMEIGAGEAIPGFEDALIGAVVGKTMGFDLDFPADYFSDKLAGKKAHFDVEPLAVETPVLPAVDETFIRERARVEAGTMEALREDVKVKLAETAKRQLNASLKETLLDYLLSQHTELSVPKGLIEQELTALHHDAHEHNHAEGESCGHSAEAERRVKLSLILGQYIREQEIKLDENKMYRAALEIAFRSQDPKAELDNIYKNTRLRNMLVSIILEEQAVDHLLDRVQETEETLSYKEMLEKLK